jgi:signal transduction histidine kinase
VKGQDILIVEDEIIVALDMRLRLESMGYRVVDVVDTAALALERAAELSPELVLMDIKLKGDKDGIEAAIQLRERSEVPVIFVTAFTDERTLDRAKRASPYGYVVKPFHERELRIAIELAVYKHQYELSIRRAKDIAEESNRIKGDFLANMSHELKTPLNSVIGFTELAMSASKDREQREHLAIALSSARSLLTLIDSILDFARMEAGKLLAASAPFSLDELLGECADSLAIAAFSKGLEVSLRRAPEIPDYLVGDAPLLKHILLNLLDNAVKFTDSGQVRIAVSLFDKGECAGCGPTVQFEISDTGMGMAKEKIPLAFARFSQLDPSKTRKAGGTGLGLAIVAKSVELMEGEIVVESEEGRGTRFTLRIPFDVGVDELSTPGCPPPRGGGRVSLVGFDEEAFEDAALALSRLGFTASKVESLEEAAAGSKGFVLADELLFAEVDEALVEALASRLVIATRIGGDTRAMYGRDGIAFASIPLQSPALGRAFASLGGPPGPGTSESGQMDASSALPSAGDGILERLASVLDVAADEGAFARAEREAKSAQSALIEAKDKEGSRLAFAALLSARKGNRDALKGNVARIRETARMREVAGREGS